MRRHKRKIIFLAIALTTGLLVWAIPNLLLTTIAYAITIIYIAWGVYNVIIFFSGLHPPLNPGITLKEYPKISVIIPAKNEPILGRTIEVCLHHIDYPLNKKEIIVVTDDPVGERIAFWYQQRYPRNVKLLARRKLFPTKPSALNDALQLATGEIIAIVDVEDIPDRDVFLKAAAALTKHGYHAAQVILRISNQDDSWITRIFAMEYAGWFRIMLNGRARIGSYTPLGGTGNYFLRNVIALVGGWDAINLAEDAEIGVRLAIAGRRVAVIDARHWEEAPTSFNAWLRQRTRWFRGWLQSLWKYLEVIVNPAGLKLLGLTGLINVAFMLVNPIILILNWVAYGLTVLWILDFLGIMPGVMANIFPIWSIIPLTLNPLYYYIAFKGAELEGIKGNLRYLPHMLVYLNLMLPLAAARAFYHEVFKPVFWEKTEHPGLGVRWAVAERIR